MVAVVLYSVTRRVLILLSYVMHFFCRSCENLLARQEHLVANEMINLQLGICEVMGSSPVGDSGLFSLFHARSNISSLSFSC